MVHYVCRRCGRWIGGYPGTWQDPWLGLATLSEAERAEIVEVATSGRGDAVVKILCEDCLPMPMSDGLWYN